MPFERIPLDSFARIFGTLTELSSVALDGKIIEVSDEFFAEASNLIKVEPAVSLKGQFGPNGALYSGWETRRHNPSYDWCIIKFGAAGLISGFDIDTSHFNGNEAPEASVDVLLDAGDNPPSADDARWKEILPKVALGPSSRHLFKIENPETYNYVKLNMYPDGGIARFRVYGFVRSAFSEDVNDSVDLAHVFSGGRVVATSDQHFGVGSNLLLPGRGKDMGDGWETKRSRTTGHKDWVIMKLGESGRLEKVEIDTAHFKGNFPESVELHAINHPEVVLPLDESSWKLILSRKKLGPDARHFFDLENADESIYSHVRVTIYPDGGIKRVRIIGKRSQETDVRTKAGATIRDGTNLSNSHSVALTATPLRAEAFAPFGHVVQAYSSKDLAPNGTKVTTANQGSALKFHKLAPIVSFYPSPPPGAPSATPGLSVYRCSPLDFDFKVDYEQGGKGWPVRLLERHQYTNQAFIPMGVGSGDESSLRIEGSAYLIIVAENGEDDKPNLTTLRAFVAGTGQAIVYAPGVWHHPMVALNTTIDFTCVETQIGDGSTADCEISYLNETKGLPRIKIQSS